jgi:hypothetical protein
MCEFLSLSSSSELQVLDCKIAGIRVCQIYTRRYLFNLDCDTFVSVAKTGPSVGWFRGGRSTMGNVFGTFSI